MTVRKKQVLWEGRFLRSLLLSYIGPDGENHSWEAYERPGIRGIVAVLPITDGGEVLFIRQFRPPVDAWVWEVPAGLHDREESFEDCARRELREETGFHAEHCEQIATVPSSPASTRDMLTVFLATGLRWVGISGRDPNESIEVVPVPLADSAGFLVEQIERGELVDPKVFGILELCRRRLGAGQNIMANK